MIKLQIQQKLSRANAFWEYYLCKFSQSGAPGYLEHQRHGDD